MIKNKIGNISQLIFKPHVNCHFANNIYMLQERDRVLLIDTGYKEQGELLYNNLSKQKLKVDSIIISHFHDDHMDGLKHFKVNNIYGHKNYQQTLDKWTIKEDHCYFKPSSLLSSTTEIKFGCHNLTIIPLNGGHSESDLIILIDDKYLHISDLILQNPNGKPILPSVDKDLLYNHINALEKLKSYIDYPFLLSHGPTIFDKKIKLREINDRIRYLEVLFNNSYISYQEATTNCIQDYLHSEWHDLFY